MASEIQGLNQAVRNAADAQAYLATTEGAMEEIHTILLRIRELAVQGSNGTYTAQDRQALRPRYMICKLKLTEFQQIQPLII